MLAETQSVSMNALSSFSKVIGSQRTVSSRSIAKSGKATCRRETIASFSNFSEEELCNQSYKTLPLLIGVQENHSQGNLVFKAFARQTSMSEQISSNNNGIKAANIDCPMEKSISPPPTTTGSNGSPVNTNGRLPETEKSQLARGYFEDNHERKQALLDNVFASCELQLICNLDLENMPAEQILSIMTADKMTSFAFQQFIHTCWVGQFWLVKKVVLQNLDWLTTHQLGNYVVQKLLIRDGDIRHEVTELCQELFETYCLNEYASRVMQTLVEVSENFRQFVICRFRNDPWSCTANIAAVFLASAVIKFSIDFSEVDFVRTMIRQNLREVLACKNMKRVLMTYCECCPFATLHELYEELGLYHGLAHVCNNKILTYVFLSFLFRDHAAAKAQLAQGVQNQLNTLQKTKFFRFLLERAVKSRSHPSLALFVRDLLGRCLKKQSNIGSAILSKHDRFLLSLLNDSEECKDI